MIRLLILAGIVVTATYINVNLLFGILIGLAYSIMCGIIDERRDGGDC